MQNFQMRNPTYSGLTQRRLVIATGTECREAISGTLRLRRYRLS